MSTKTMPASVTEADPQSSIAGNAHNQAIADTYDAVPYQSRPFAQSAPEQLATMATLFGLTPPDFRFARVLELGCSAGGNLIPLAAKYPGLTAVGVDISKVQIEQGKEVIRKAGVKNCDLRALDIGKAKSEITGQFDYIVCHGVFSWVPETVRIAILDIIRDHLSAKGVAYVSYNVYPGWKMREVIREMMLVHAGNRQSPAERLGQAKAILEYTKNISTEQSTYGKMLRDEALQVSRSDDYYLHHEYLEIENNPMYFRDFVGLASARKLSYLGESVLSSMTPQRLGKDINNTLQMLSGGNILATEQYMDFFTNRTFRQTVLVHEAQAASINRDLGPQSMRQFSISTSLVANPEFRAVSGQMPLAQYKDEFGRNLPVNGTLLLELIKVLVDAKPGAIAFSKIVDKMKAAVPALAAISDLEVDEAVGSALMNLLIQNFIKLSLDEVTVKPLSNRPQAYALARVQAELGQTWVTNLVHQPVGVSAAHRSVLTLLDGTRDHAALQVELLAQLKDGRLMAKRGQDRITSETELIQLSIQICGQTLNDLRQMLVLAS